MAMKKKTREEIVRLLRVQDVAVLVGVTERAVYRWVQEGKIPVVRLPRHDAPKPEIRFDPAEIERWMKANTIENR